MGGRARIGPRVLIPRHIRLHIAIVYVEFFVLYTLCAGAFASGRRLARYT